MFPPVFPCVPSSPLSVSVPVWSSWSSAQPFQHTCLAIISFTSPECPCPLSHLFPLSPISNSHRYTDPDPLFSARSSVLPWTCVVPLDSPAMFFVSLVFMPVFLSLDPLPACLPVYLLASQPLKHLLNYICSVSCIWVLSCLWSEPLQYIVYEMFNIPYWHLLHCITVNSQIKVRIEIISGARGQHSIMFISTAPIRTAEFHAHLSAENTF